jgi:hypothetical protein
VPGSGEQLAQGVRVDVVTKSLDPVDLHERYPAPIPLLERGIRADIDERVVVAADRTNGVVGRVAEVAAGRGVEDDAAQG